MAKKRTYSDQEKAEALAHLDSVGGNLTLAANQLGIPRGTLRSWSESEQHVDVADLRHKKRNQLREMLMEWALKMLNLALEEDRLQGASFRELVTGIGVAIDKISVLSDANEGMESAAEKFMRALGNVVATESETSQDDS